MAWDLTELRREIVLDFADAQSLLEQRASSVWWHVHACYVRNQQLAKKRWSLRALRKRLFLRDAIECKNPKCRVRFVPYRAGTKYCTVECRVRSLALAAYHARQGTRPPSVQCCALCGEVFGGRKRGATYCSKRCKAQASGIRRQARLVRTVVTRACAWCTKPIAGGRSDKKYCSEPCADAAHWRRYSARHREQLNAAARRRYHAAR